MEPEAPKNVEPEDSSEKPYKYSAIDYFYDGLVWVYKKFMRFVSINEDDHIALVGFKILMRAVGVLILLILSPFIITGFIIVVLLVS